MSDLTPTTAPNEEASPGQVDSAETTILPAQIFFADLIEAPEEITSEEIDALVELEIEQSSPFPIEQLTWGWVLINDGRTVLTFATTLEKAKNAGASDFDSAHAPIVAPFTVAAYQPEGAACAILHGKFQDVVAIHYEKGQAVAVEAFALEENAEEAQYAQHARSLFSLADSASCAHLYLGQAERNDDIGLSWSIFPTANTGPDKAPTHTTEIPADQAWYLDLRNREFKIQRQEELKRSSRIWKALSILMMVVVVMLLLEIVQWSARQYLGFQEVSIAQQAPIVERLEEQDAFLHKMSAIEQSQVRPFALLAILNENRPDKIHFLRAEAASATEYEFQLQGSTVSEVNNYISSYEGNPAFKSVDHKITSSRSGRVLFDLKIEVDQLPEVAALSPEETETSDAAKEGQDS